MAPSADSIPAPAVQNAGVIGIGSLPNQRHKIVAKKGADFTLMVAGESGLGKTTLINTLFSTDIKPYQNPRTRHNPQPTRTTHISISRAHLSERDFTLNLTVIDTPGFGDFVSNKNAWSPIAEFLDDQHESYMRQEQQPMREGRVDMRVHACLYFIRPTGHTLRPIDIEAMKALGTRVNLIPVIAKADTIGAQDLEIFKERIRNVIRAQNISIFDPPENTDGTPFLPPPYALIASTQTHQTPAGPVLGRQYLWGIAEVENPLHCDFVHLRSLILRTHMLDLILATEETHYESYRRSQMEIRKFGESKARRTADNPKFREEEEALRKRFTEQVKVEENRFRSWEQRLIQERDRLNKDLEVAHASVKALESELEAMTLGAGSGRSTGRSMVR
ncbi:Septin spn4 [Saitoella coloradoensis]